MYRKSLPLVEETTDKIVEALKENKKETTFIAHNKIKNILSSPKGGAFWKTKNAEKSHSQKRTSNTGQEEKSETP